MDQFRVLVASYYIMNMSRSRDGWLWLTNRVSPTCLTLLSWPLFALKLTPGLLVLITRCATYAVSSILIEYEYLIRMSVLLPIYYLYTQCYALISIIEESGVTTEFITNALITITSAFGCVLVLLRSGITYRSSFKQLDEPVTSLVTENLNNRYGSLSSTNPALVAASRLEVSSAGNRLRSLVSCWCACYGTSPRAGLICVTAPAAGPQDERDDSANLMPLPLSDLRMTFDAIPFVALILIIWIINVLICLLGKVLTGERLCDHIRAPTILTRRRDIRHSNNQERTESESHELQSLGLSAIIQVETATSDSTQPSPHSDELESVVID